MEYIIRTLGSVAQYINGRAFKPTEWETEGKPIIRIQNLTNPETPYNYSKKQFEDKYLVHNGDLLFSWSASLGAHIWKGEEAWLNQHIFRIVPNDIIIRDYLYYFLLTVAAELYSKTHGSGMVHITKGPFLNTSIPVPSIIEQERIVSRVDELLSQLETGVETLKKIKEQLAVYRQAVLMEELEKANGTEYCIRETCHEIKVGIVIKPTQYYVESDGIYAFRNANVRRGYIEDCNWVMISKEGHESNKKSEVHTGDVLISRSGANLGMAAPVSEKYNGYNAIDVVIAVPLKSVIKPEFLAYYTNSPAGRKVLKKNERGGAQAHINVTEYGKLPIKVPSIEEQERIINSIETRLSVCDSIEQTVDSALQQAEAMRQSILKQAFEGRL